MNKVTVEYVPETKVILVTDPSMFISELTFMRRFEEKSGVEYLQCLRNDRISDIPIIDGEAKNPYTEYAGAAYRTTAALVKYYNECEVKPEISEPSFSFF
ncbi:hypothetical protein [Pseudoalteromonas phage J2-1_QLiu-2017]|nr:hypothetical protein [Pseudoalteromonas phage J2-1_QLiu-2017]